MSRPLALNDNQTRSYGKCVVFDIPYFHNDVCVDPCLYYGGSPGVWPFRPLALSPPR